ncbi:MAG: tetratricopeptide repeat protein [Gemmatales bacterium]
MALTQMKENLALAEKHFGPEGQHTLIARDNLGTAFVEMGRFGEAIPLLQTTYEQRKKLMGPEHETTLKSLNNLAMAYQASGQHCAGSAAAGRVAETLGAA